jgi:HEPN domain-containing protein
MVRESRIGFSCRAAARKGLGTTPRDYCFPLQQDAEKYLKAFLVSLQIEFPKTHDLEELLELLTPVRPDVAAMLEGIEVLNPFGVKIRYPGDFPELLPGQEQIVFDLANRTREAIMAQLQQHLAGG